MKIQPTFQYEIVVALVFLINLYFTCKWVFQLDQFKDSEEQHHTWLSHISCIFCTQNDKWTEKKLSAKDLQTQAILIRAHHLENDFTEGDHVST